MSKTIDPSPVDSAATADPNPQDRQKEQGPSEPSPASAMIAAPEKAMSDAHPTIVEDGEHGPRHARHPA